MSIKKIFAAALAMSMTGAMLTACGSSDDSSTASTADTTTTTTTPATTTTTPAAEESSVADKSTADDSVAEAEEFVLADDAYCAYFGGGTDGFGTSSLWWKVDDNAVAADINPPASTITPASVDKDGEYTVKCHLDYDPEASEWTVCGIYLSLGEDDAKKMGFTGEEKTVDEMPVVLSLVSVKIDGSDVAFDDADCLKYYQSGEVKLELINTYNTASATADKLATVPTSDIEITFSVAGLDDAKAKL